MCASFFHNMVLYYFFRHNMCASKARIRTIGLQAALIHCLLFSIKSKEGLHLHLPPVAHGVSYAHHCCQSFLLQRKLLKGFRNLTLKCSMVIFKLYILILSKR